MKIAIAGGSGFVGQHLADYLIEKGHDIYVLSRKERKSSNPKLHYIQWMNNGSTPEKYLEGINVVINLAGKSINDRWTEEAKQQIVQSRVKSTRELIRIIDFLDQKPSIVINASAVGIYGTSRTETFTEKSTPQGNDFLASTVEAWEYEASQFKDFSIRTILLRFGIILGEQGALPKMVLPYKYFAGGTVGSGEQWVSWIHVDDVVRLIEFAIEQPTIAGPVNAASPNPVQMKTFGQTIAKVLGRPHWIPAPSFALKGLLGEMSLLVLEGQKVLPKQALISGFTFSFPHLEEALVSILRSSKQPVLK
ncbi:TIGR01777 family oxidoreductase [Metabacillus arenae]|uniref:TIGR01777 family protein n=1 Tax=Metabacillus arenae TaxID=2771434 RepID=A0A926RW78_9BACI|nr:TIGR01777 family oxidoreductase [Metabacillus arenae]MBD1379651.1 TIGR01777 family protein [Metabacillus arenae]